MKGENMLKRLKNIKNVLKNKKGFITVEALSWIAVISIIIVAVAVVLKPDIVGSNSILTNSSGRIRGLEDVMKP